MSPKLLKIVRKAAREIDRSMVVKNLDYHRNGVAGEGFHVVTFAYRIGNVRRSMVAVLFGADSEYPSPEIRTAVMDTDLLARGVIEMAEGNAWRGDNFDPALRAAVAAYANGWEAYELPHIRANAGKLAR